MEKIAKCVFCGEDFVVNLRGRKSDHCRKESCMIQARRRSDHKHLEKKKKIKLQQKEIVEDKVKSNEVLYSKEDSIDLKLSQPDIADIVSLARGYTDIRFQLDEILAKDSKVLSDCDKIEINLLHEIENKANITVQDAMDFVKKIKKNREVRRIYKNRAYLMKTIKENMHIKNASEFVIKAVNRQKNFEYIERTVEELKTDENLYEV